MSSSPTTTVRTAAQIRQEFIDYFVQKRGHTFVPSSPVIPHDDPTLMFTNAGMNQFKDVFLGHGERPYVRAANSQKVIRAGGKHNDLEDVGKDTYHHTYFEMLGNWSFGDYFKAEAIEWAWDLLTNVWGLDPDRMYTSVFAGEPGEGLEPDLEAEELWKRHVEPGRISRWSKKDNFWEMGDTGPCGPCSEIHYDFRSDADRASVPGSELVNADHPEMIEIWNLVFIQYNRGADGVLTPLPAKHVDTGMGFERLVRVLQGKSSNYDTDIWTPIFAAIERESGARAYTGHLDDPVDVAYQVIADHIRCLTVAITDGGRPSSEKAGYVLRRILRRAVRHAHQTLGVQGPLLHRLVPTVVDSMGEAFPELKKNPAHVAEIIHDEEESFLRTLDRGLALFADAADDATGGRIGADIAFKLHDTYGFPIDLTRVMAEERGLGVDEPGFEKLMEEARERSRKTGEGEAGLELPPEALARLRYKGLKASDDVDKFHGRPITASVKAIWNGEDFDDEIPGKRESVAIICDRTNFYAESGGQVGDHGVIRDVDEDHSEFVVSDTRTYGEYVAHIGHLIKGRITVGEKLQLTVDRDHRNPVRANHTATHLLNQALHAIVGEDEQQKGSLVAPDRLRFDFSCPHALKDEDLSRIESLVNEAIASGQAVYADVVPLETAQRIAGVRAVFGERYPDPVRVVSIGAPVDELVKDPENERWKAHSIEFCGGTHLATTDETQRFVIVQEGALAAGVRRIVALTGAAAEASMRAGEQLVERAKQAETLDGAALEDETQRIARLLEEMDVPAAMRHHVTATLDGLRKRVKTQRKQEQAGARDGVVAAARSIADGASGEFIVETIDGADTDLLMNAMDVIRSRRPDAAVMLLSPDHLGGKVAIVAAVPKPLIERGLQAGQWIKQAATTCGGGGGGRPDMARAGGKDPTRTPEAVAAAKQFAREALA